MSVVWLFGMRLRIEVTEVNKRDTGTRILIVLKEHPVKRESLVNW